MDGRPPNLVHMNKLAKAACGKRYPSAVTLDDGMILMLWYAIGSVADENLRWHCEALRFREEDVIRSLP